MFGVRRCRVVKVVVALLVALAGGLEVRAQCDAWQPFVANGFTGTGNANCMTAWNGDLVVGGNFINVAGVERNRIVRWDGDSPPSGTWHSFTSGGQIGVDGPFGIQVFALTVFNGDLIAGGRFDTAGGQTVNNIARWVGPPNGGSWQPLTSGGQIGLNSTVRALAVYNGSLYAGGDFWMAGGQTVNSIARWDGTNWNPIVAGGQTGVGGGVKSMCLWNNKLAVGGFFSTAGGQFTNYVAAWDGTTWERFIANGQTGVGGLSPQVDALTDWNGSLVAGGTFTTAGGQTVNRIARWDAASGAWHPFTSGGEIGVNSPDISPQVFALTTYNDDLIAGGYFPTAGGQTVNHIARWDGISEAWAPFTMSGQNGVDFTVLSLATWDANLVAGGSFANAGGTLVNRIARWEDCEGGAVCIADIAPVGPPQGNGVVNVDDLLAVINAWGPCGGGCAADIAPAGPPQGNGVVNVDDLLAIINAWGPCE